MIFSIKRYYIGPCTGKEMMVCPIPTRTERTEVVSADSIEDAAQKLGLAAYQPPGFPHPLYVKNDPEVLAELKRREAGETMQNLYLYGMEFVEVREVKTFADLGL